MENKRKAKKVRFEADEKGKKYKKNLFQIKPYQKLIQFTKFLIYPVHIGLFRLGLYTTRVHKEARRAVCKRVANSVRQTLPKSIRTSSRVGNQARTYIFRSGKIFSFDCLTNYYRY